MAKGVAKDPASRAATSGYEVGRKPEYVLRAKVRGPGPYGTVGAAWVNEDESLSIKLNPFVVLEEQSVLTIMLYPAEPKS